MTVYQNLKYVNSMSEGKHQKVIPSRLRSVCLAQCLILHFWQNWCNCSVGLGWRVRSIHQQRLEHTSPNSKTWARAMAERVQHPFSSSCPSNPCLSEMPLPQNHGAVPPSSPLAVVMLYGDKQVAHSKVWRSISSPFVFKCSFLNQGNMASGQGKGWTTLIWAIQHIKL